MARDKGTQQDIDGSNLPDYPNKRIRDDDGSGNGTPVSESVYGDIHEFFAKMMRESGLTYNNVPDNTTNGYQLYDAMLLLANKNDYVTALAQASADTLQVSFPLNPFKTNECIFLRATVDSSVAAAPTVFIKIKGSDSVVKACSILGSGFKTGDLVRIINTGTSIQLVGLYDSVNVPNLAKRLNDLEDLFAPVAKKLAVFQAGGGMVLWNKPALLIPEGWAEVTNWRGRIPAGYIVGDAVFGIGGEVGGQGGSWKKKLAVEELPPHNHGFRAYTKSGSNDGSGGEDAGYFEDKVTTNTGGGQEFNIMNPYRTVLFIEYVE